MADEIEGTEAPASKAPEKNPLVAILLVTNIIGLGLIAFLQFKAHKREASRPSLRDVVKAQMKELENEVKEDMDAEANKGSDVEGKLLPLDGFTANLSQGDGPRRFVRLKIVLKFDVASREDEFKSRKPQIRDAIISILNSKRPEDLLKMEGKSFLKQEIKSAINSFLIDGQVIDVYYIGFQIN